MLSSIHCKFQLHQHLACFEARNYLTNLKFYTVFTFTQAQQWQHCKLKSLKRKTYCFIIKYLLILFKVRFWLNLCSLLHRGIFHSESQIKGEHCKSRMRKWLKKFTGLSQRSIFFFSYQCSHILHRKAFINLIFF